MEGELHDDNLVHEQEEDSTSTPENVPDSSLSGDETTDPLVPSPRKSRKGAQKKVVSVPIDGADASARSKGEVYPPSDSWSWRKYGQKPIKGSPYPRGYYRCSSSKGCPARKQVERSRLDPTMLLITYAHDHNHRPFPRTTTKHHHHHHHRPSTNAASGTTTTSPTTTTTRTDQAKVQPEEFAVFADPPENGDFSGFTAELGWFSDVGSTAMIESSTLEWASDADFAVMLPIGEEDQSLFGDLGELPEYSVVFRHRRGAETPCYGGA